MNTHHGRKATVRVSILAILFLAPVFGPLLTPTVKASTTWTVDDDGNADFSKIQDAIGRANDGDTILVFAGVYNEQILVNKSVNITGQGDTSTMIDGNDADSVVTLAVSGTSFSGFTIQNGGEGLRVLSNGNNITGNFIVSNDVGVILDTGCNGNILSDNGIVLSSTYGVYGDRCGKNEISHNEISFNNWDGVFIYGSAPCILENNSISSNGLNGAILRYSSNNTIAGNTFLANKIGLYILSDEDPIRPSGLSKYNIIEQNTVLNNSCGIKIEHAAKNVNSAENLIRDNLIAENDLGLNVSGSCGNSVYHNNFVNNSGQVSLIESYNNTWDLGYHVGGNFWADHSVDDSYWGISQNETGSDGIVDSAYVVSENLSTDLYPFVHQDGWLEDLELMVVSPISGMYRKNNIPLSLAMNKPVSASYVLDGQPNVNITHNMVLSDVSIGVHNVTIVANDCIGKEVTLEVLFTITFLADISLDGVVNIIDISIVAYSFNSYVGSERWNPDADLNSDGEVNIVDIAMVAKEFGSEIPS
jgi:parallel beta-helix repeat protein